MPVSQHKEITKITAQALFFLPSRVVFSFINYLFLLDRLPSDFIPSTFPCLFLKGGVVCCLFNIAVSEITFELRMQNFSSGYISTFNVL